MILKILNSRLSLFSFIVLVFICSSCAPRIQKINRPPQDTLPLQPGNVVIDDVSLDDAENNLPSIQDTEETFADESSSRKKSTLGIGTMEYRTRSYAKRREKWQDLERQMVALEFQGRPRAWYRCLHEVISLSGQYAEVLDGQEAGHVFEHSDVLRQDILYLESGCDAVRKIGRDALGEWLDYKVFQDQDDQPPIGQLSGGKMTSMELSRELLASLPEHRLEPEVRRSYALGLLQAGQLEAATNLLDGMKGVALLSDDSILLGRKVADLLLATGRVEDAVKRYETLEGFFSTLHGADRWVTEQLALLRSEMVQSEFFPVFLTIMRSYLLFDGHTIPAGMEEGVARLEQDAPKSPIAVRGRQLFAMVEEKVLSWVDSQLVVADDLVEKMEFEAALEVLQGVQNLKGLGDVPEEMIRDAIAKVQLAQSLEIETQRMLQEQELAIQWEDALTLLDLKQFDEAITIFSNLLDTGYQGQAEEKIAEASNMAAKQLRRQASSLFVEARKAVDPERKRILLAESLDLLRTIEVRYPKAEILEKVRQNLSYLEEYIGRFDPSLLEISGKVQNTSEEALVLEVEEEILQ